MIVANTAERPVEVSAGGTLVCFAVRAEASHFHPVPAERCRIVISGMGRRNAAAAIAEALASYSPRLVLTCGFAGGLNPALQRGDVLFDAGGDLARHLVELGAHAGTFQCADQIAIRAADKQQLRRGFQADAVEMESGIIRALCRERGIAAATVRVISDDAATDLPLDFNRLSKPDGNISYARLAAALVRSPGAIPRLMQFQRDLDLCSRRLASVLEGLLGRINSGRPAASADQE